MTARPYAARPYAARRYAAPFAAALVAALALTACGAGKRPGTPLATESPSALASTPAAVTTTSPPPAPPATMRATVYWLGGTAARPVLYRETRIVARSTAVVRSAVEAMLRLTPLDPDYRSSWPRATTVNGVSVAGAVATVDLSGNARNVTATAATEQASLQQLVHTVNAAAPSITSVRLRFDGFPKANLWGHVPTTGPVARGAQEDTLAPVWVTGPAAGADVGRTFAVTGVATVFEATVTWAVTRPGATTPLAHGFVTASRGAPDRGDFTVNVTLPATVHGDVVFTAWESSADDGSAQFPDSKTYRVA
jgi:hypothetical protein